MPTIKQHNWIPTWFQCGPPREQYLVIKVTKSNSSYKVAFNCKTTAVFLAFFTIKMKSNCQMISSNIIDEIISGLSVSSWQTWHMNGFHWILLSWFATAATIKAWIQWTFKSISRNMRSSLSLTNSSQYCFLLDFQKLKCMTLLSIFIGSINIYKHKIGTLHLHFDSELEQNYVNKKLKTVTAYYGKLVVDSS